MEKDGNDVIIKINGRLVKVPQNALVQTESGPKVMMTRKLLQEVMENANKEEAEEVAGAAGAAVEADKTGTVQFRNNGAEGTNCIV